MKPLTKARSSPHRNELAEYIIVRSLSPLLSLFTRSLRLHTPSPHSLSSFAIPSALSPHSLLSRPCQTIVPFHSHYPATTFDDLDEDAIKFKLRYE